MAGTSAPRASEPPRRRAGVFTLALAMGLLAAGAGCGLLSPRAEPEARARALARSVVEGLLALDPERASELRLFEGEDPRGGVWTDVSPAATERRRAFLTESLARARRLEADGLSPAGGEAWATLLWSLEDAERGAPYRYHDFPLNPVFGVQNRAIALLTQVQPVRSESEAAAYLARLRGLDAKVAGLVAALRQREERGVVPPRPALARVRDQLERFLETPVDAHPLQRSFEEKLRGADLSPESRRRWAEASAQALREVVRPAWARLLAEAERLHATAPAEIGVWQLPDGDAYYAYLVRHHTTTDATPAALHELGRAEVDRIQRAMRRIHGAAGVPPDLPFQESLARYYEGLEGEQDLTYPDTEAGRAAALADYAALIDDARRRLAPLFVRVPGTPVRVERIPPAVEASTPAHYRPPAFDGSRPGVFYANLAWPPWRPGMPTLTYHETVPGHHFHLALVREQPGLWLHQRVLPFTAHVEGWALYAERLAREQGFLEDAAPRHQSLWSELFRAARLVVDTGIHRERWPRERAVRTMREILGADMTLEVDRYAVMPGQALAYKTGELEILRLRASARRRRGDAFDLAVFHHAVVGGGHMPLPVLARRAERLTAEAASR